VTVQVDNLLVQIDNLLVQNIYCVLTTGTISLSTQVAIVDGNTINCMLTDNTLPVSLFSDNGMFTVLTVLYKYLCLTSVVFRVSMC